MVHTFLKSISLKVNVIARQEFELAYNDFAVLPLRNAYHYATVTLLTHSIGQKFFFKYRQWKKWTIFFIIVPNLNETLIVQTHIGSDYFPTTTPY